MSDVNRRLMTRKSDFGETLLESVAAPEPGEGEVVLALDRFSLTTNNITYAAYGDAIGYWKMFPTGREDHGLMPVWGFADVAASRAAGIEVGARVFGYFPMADRLVVQAEKISKGGFADAAPWNNWQGYFLGLIGGKDGDWAYANLGVFFALVLGFVVTWFGRAGRIRRQEQA